MITKFTEKELNDMCQEVLNVFKKYHADDAEVLGAMFLIMGQIYRVRLVQNPRKREALADLIETQFHHLNEDVFGER